MKKTIIVLLLLLLPAGLLIWAGTGFADNNDNISLILDGTRLYDKSFEMLEEVNKVRKEAGLNTLVMDGTLLEDSMLRAAETAVYWSHTRPDNKSCFTAFTNTYKTAGENIAAGSTSVTATMDALLNSASHKENILYPEYNNIGIGVFRNNGITYWVQSFSYSSTWTEAKKQDNRDVSQTITVNPDNLCLRMNYPELVLTQGGSQPLCIYNDNLTLENVAAHLNSNAFIWRSSDENLAAINSIYKVTAVAAGNAVITASVGDVAVKCNLKITNLDYVQNLQSLAFNKKILINWEAVDKAEGYYIYAAYADGSLYKTYTTANTYCNFTDLTNDKKYSFKVRAYRKLSGKTVYGEYCTAVSAVPYDDTVKNITAAAGNNKIKLSWDAVTEADGYYIYAMYSDGSKYKTYSTSKTACNFTKLSNGDKYQFKIREYKDDTAGTRIYGTYSAVVAAVPVPDAVSTPEALAFNKKVRINWPAVSGAIGYYIQVTYADGNLYKTYATAKTYCNFTGLINDTQYVFKVRAYCQNYAGSKVYGAYSGSVVGMPYDDTVTNLKAVASDSKIKISWGTVTAADGYYIYAMYADGSKYKTYSTTRTSCSFTSLTNNSTYKFKVRAFKTDNTGTKVYSTYSSVVSTVPKA